MRGEGKIPEYREICTCSKITNTCTKILFTYFIIIDFIFIILLIKSVSVIPLSVIGKNFKCNEFITQRFVLPSY